MARRLAAAGKRVPVAILLIGLVIAALSIGYGSGVSAHLKGGGFLVDDADSSVAANLLATEYHVGQPNFLVVLTADEPVDSPDVRRVAEQLIDELDGNPGVTGITSFWTAPFPLSEQLRSNDGRSGVITAQVLGNDSDAPVFAAQLADRLNGTRDRVEVRCGGYALIGYEINRQAQHDLIVAEAIAIPITALVLIWAFGSLVASLLPVVIGVFAVAVSFAILRAVTTVTDVSVFALNMATALSLALAIDYSLLMVTRFREELADGHDSAAAVARTVRTAGRTVLFSAVTVACGLAALAVFPQYFLRSFAYAGLCVVASSAIASTVLVPAVLRLVGTRINALDVRRLVGRREPPAPAPESSPWYRLAVRVSRRPGIVAAVAIVFLLLLGAPFLGVRFGVPDDRVIDEKAASSRVVADLVREQFPHDPAAATVAVLPDYSGPPEALYAYARALSDVAGVHTVVSPLARFRAGDNAGPVPAGRLPDDLVFIISEVDPYSDDGAAQIRLLRDVPSPGPVYFAGAAPANVDVVDSLLDGLPMAAALMGIATFVLLFLFTGSLVLPVKAIVLNVLSLSASFGAMVWIFQDGNLAGLLGVTATGYIVPAMPILMFCLAFGMSMDYEVFVLSRIREEWLASGRTAADNTRSVAIGIARTGRIVTVAAILMAIVFFAMVSSKISMMQLFGLGLAVMALVDAFVVRSVLVPAVMQFLGRWNWWPATRRGAIGEPAH